MQNLNGFITIVTLCLIIVMGAVVMDKKPTVVYSNKTTNRIIDSLIIECMAKDSVIRSWEDHALRMKRIVGVPDTVSWSYKTKVIHNIDTRRVVGKNRQ
jgi:hypothetical protein